MDTQIHALPRRIPHETPCVTIARAILHWQLISKYQDDKDFYERQAARRRAVWQLEIFAAGTVNIFIRARKKFYHRGWKRRARRAKARRPNREGTVDSATESLSECESRCLVKITTLSSERKTNESYAIPRRHNVYVEYRVASRKVFSFPRGRIESRQPRRETAVGRPREMLRSFRFADRDVALL